MNARERSIWGVALSLFGLLALSSMAGMGIGGGIFLLTSAVLLFRSWKRGGAEMLGYFRSSAWAYLSLAYFLVSLLSLWIANANPLVPEMPMGFAELKKFHYFLYPPLVALALLQSSDELEEHSLWRVWGVVGTLLGLTAIAQFWASEIFPAEWLENRFFRRIGTTPRFHAQGIMYFHLSFASCMSFLAGLGLARALWPRLHDTRSSRALWAGLGFLSMLAVFYSYSRISFFAMAALLAFLCFLKRPLWGVIAALLLVVAGGVAWQKSETLQRRWIDTQVGNQERVLMWESAWTMFRDRPLTGVGFGRTGEHSPAYATRILGYRPQFTSHAHNNVLDALGSTGILGFLCYLLWWGLLFWIAVRAFRASPSEERWLPAAVLAGFVAFQINGITQINFWDGKSETMLMIWVGIALALSMRMKAEAGHVLVGRR